MKNKLNKPDVESTLTTFGESITINKTTPNQPFKDIFITGTTVEERIYTEKEIIKEWDSLGFEWIDTGRRITLASKETYDGYRKMTIAIIYKDVKKYSSSYLLDMELHKLLTKTFKMLGWE